MVYSAWLAPFGWGIFIVGLIVAIVLYSIKGKFYPVMYLISISLYVFTMGFIIDAFDLGKSLTLLLLALTAVLFIVLGMFFSRKFEGRKNDFLSKVPKKTVRK